MSKSDFEAYADFYIYLFRTDSWNQVGTGDDAMRLCTTKMV